MNYREAIKGGFGVINRNWQLVAIQVVVMLINCLGFFIVVVLPVVIVAVAIGLDVEGLSNLKDLPHDFGNYISNYMGLIAAGIFFLLIYLVVISVLAIYMYGASSGVIAYSINNPIEKFSLRRFFREGKRLFWPMFGYLAVVGLLLMALIIFVAVLFVIVIVMVDFLKGLDSHIGFFASIFLALLSISVMLLSITFGLAVTFYGTAFLVFQGKSAFVSVKEAIQYIYKKQSAYWLYCIVIGASVVAAIILTLMGLPFNEIPVVGVFIALPYQFFTYVVQSYLGLFSLAVIFVYFYSGISVDASIQASDTFVQGDPGQGGIPPQ